MLRLLLLFVLIWKCSTSAPTATDGDEEKETPKLYDDEVLLNSDFVTAQPKENTTLISILKGWMYNETGEREAAPSNLETRPNVINSTPISVIKGTREKRTLKKKWGCNTCGGGGGGGFIVPVVVVKQYPRVQSGCHGCNTGCRGGCGGGGGGGGSYSYSSSQSSSYSSSWGRK